MAGMSDLGGVKFFNLSVETPEGDMELLQVVMDGGCGGLVFGGVLTGRQHDLGLVQQATRHTQPSSPVCAKVPTLPLVRS
jgi:hypothetical protein